MVQNVEQIEASGSPAEESLCDRISSLIPGADWDPSSTPKRHHDLALDDSELLWLRGTAPSADAPSRSRPRSSPMATHRQGEKETSAAVEASADSRSNMVTRFVMRKMPRRMASMVVRKWMKRVLSGIFLVLVGVGILTLHAQSEQLIPWSAARNHPSSVSKGTLSTPQTASLLRRTHPASQPPTPDEKPPAAHVGQFMDAEFERMIDIYCRGPLLHTVQMAEVYPDSKHFVDMPIKRNSSAFEILLDFDRRRLALTRFRHVIQGEEDKNASEVTESFSTAPSEGQDEVDVLPHDVLLRQFLEEHFDPPGSDLIPITPLDYQEHSLPPMIAQIQDDVLREWAFALHQLWKNLGRIVDTSVRGSMLLARRRDKEDQLHRPQNILIVPGGRFRESYYWDSYWIVQGLLVSNMPHTARGVVNHLLEYVAEYGFVPNGGRIYYLTRSQPPMLSEMVNLIAREPNNATHVAYDLEYLRSAVPLLEKEYAFWMQRGPGGHAVELDRPVVDEHNGTVTRNVTHVLNRYVSIANHPRPESYREDVIVAGEIYATQNGYDASDLASLKAKYYNDVIAAAESGWDFSSRWLRDSYDMETMFTSCVIPVDLNAIMYRMERNLMEFNRQLGDTERAEFYERAAKQRAEAIDAILWSEEHHAWKDFSEESSNHSTIVSVSDYAPLWAKMIDPKESDRLDKVVESLEHSGLLQVGGIQTTDTFTGQQWDAPNAWPPEQDMIVEGLLAVNSARSHELARSLAKTWVKTSLTAWKKTGLMFEKYNATEVGGLGVGGEYFPQFGFGWTNGIILKFLTIHQNLLIT